MYINTFVYKDARRYDMYIDAISVTAIPFVTAIPIGFYAIWELSGKCEARLLDFGGLICSYRRNARCPWCTAWARRVRFLNWGDYVQCKLEVNKHT